MTFEDTKLCKGFTCYWRIENFVIFKPNGNSVLKSQSLKNIFEEDPELKNYFDKYPEYFEKDSEWHLEIFQQATGNLGVRILMDKGKITTLNISLYLFKKDRWITMKNNVHLEFKKCNEGFQENDLISLKEFERKTSFLSKNSLTISFVLSVVGKKMMSSQCLLISKMINEKDISHCGIKEFRTLKPSDFCNYYVSTITQLPDTIIHSPDTYEEGSMVDSFEDLLRFFRQNKFSYITLRTSNKDFAVHKALLCASSPVFNEMFNENLNKNIEVNVLMDDIDSDTVALMLKFLHLEPLEDLEWERAKKLFYAANKYQILKLKNKCVSFLKTGLSLKTIYEAFTLAELHQIEDLKGSAEKFFCDQKVQILRSSEWKDFLLTKTETASKILYDLADKLSAKNKIVNKKTLGVALKDEFWTGQPCTDVGNVKGRNSCEDAPKHIQDAITIEERRPRIAPCKNNF